MSTGSVVPVPSASSAAASGAESPPPPSVAATVRPAGVRTWATTARPRWAKAAATTASGPASWAIRRLSRARVLSGSAW